jgi:chemotaxis signal transduction protein
VTARATTDELLQRRARELARPLELADDRAATREVLRFRLATERYAVPLDDVRQVVPLAGAARLPLAAWPLVALGSVGGAIVPVVALGRSEAGAAVASSAPWAVAVAAHGTVLCLPADDVAGLVEVRDADLTAHAAGDGEDRHARGLTRDGDVLLDVEALVATVVGHADDTDRGTDDVPPDDEGRT